MTKSELLAAEYREQARQATTSAEASPLPQVQRKHEHAALVWLDLAAMQDRRTAHSRSLAARLLARASVTGGALAPEGASCTS